MWAINIEKTQETVITISFLWGRAVEFYIKKENCATANSPWIPGSQYHGVSS